MSDLNTTSPPICPFCEVKTRAVISNELAIAILSNPRKVPGHFLVLPKRHIEKPWELSAGELDDVFKLIFEIEQKVLGELGEGVDIRQNYRPFLKSNIKANHVLFHVIPRSPDDYIYNVAEQYEKKLFAELDDAESKAVQDLLNS